LDRQRNLWADAVCINQKDHAERMGHIYAYASSVLVWLGEGDDILPYLDFLWVLSISGHEHCATTEHATILTLILWSSSSICLGSNGVG
jgi:hypothetical protein